jgi:hypothetical protein
MEEDRLDLQLSKFWGSDRLHVIGVNSIVIAFRPT